MPQPPTIPPTQTTIRTVICDSAGNPVLVLMYEEGVIVEPGGALIEFKRGTNIQLVDGPLWNASFLSGNNRVVPSVCELCRHPPFRWFKVERPTHGLCGVGRICRDCGVCCCPRHLKPAGGRQVRCIRCARKRRLKDALIRLFFRVEE